MVDLGTYGWNSYAVALNNNCQVVGGIEITSNDVHATLWNVYGPCVTAGSVSMSPNAGTSAMQPSAR